MVHGLGRGEGLGGSLLLFFLLSRPCTCNGVCGGCDVLNKRGCTHPICAKSTP